MNHALYVAIPSATIAVNTWAAGADFARLGFVVKNSDDLGVARSWLPALGALKAAGAAGLLVGLGFRRLERLRWPVWCSFS